MHTPHHPRTLPQVLEASPEVLVVAAGECEGAARALAQVCALPGFWALPAVHSGRVWLLHGAYLGLPGPRLADGAEVLGHALLGPFRVPLPRGLPYGAVLRLSLAGGQRCRQSLLPNYFCPPT